MCDHTAAGHAEGSPIPASRARSAVAPRLALGLAFVAIAAWYVAINRVRPELVGDEKCHVPAIQALIHGDRSLVHALPMPPTYHWLASWVTRPVGGQLWALRVFQATLMVVAVVLFHAAARAYRTDYGACDLLRFAWNPLLFSFWVLVYTDVASLVGILVALNFYIRRRHALAALGLAAACLVRQSNLVWVVYFAAWSCSDSWPAPAKSLGETLSVWLRHVLRRARAGVWAYGVVIAAGSAMLLAGRGTVFGAALANRPSPTIAQFYLLALVAALVWLPIWLPSLIRMWTPRVVPALIRPSRVALVAAAVGLLATVFRNPHPWNMNLEYLRNWVLYAMTTYRWTCTPLAAVIVAFVTTLVLTTARSPARRVLALTWAFAGLFLLPHPVADPRYYIVPFVLIDFLTPYTPAQSRRLTIWYLLLTIGIAVVLVCQPGGVRGVI